MDNAMNGIDLNFLIISDPWEPRFDTDRTADGSATLFGKARRNLVAEAQSNRNRRFNGYNLEIDGGTAYWNGKNLSNNVVASGVYLVLLNDLDTLETKVLKLMVIR